MSGKDRVFDDDEERTGHASEKPGDHEGRQLVQSHVDADRGGPDGIVPDPLDHLAEGGPDDPVHREDAQRRHGEGEVVGAFRRGDRVGKRNPVDPVVAAGEGVPAVDDGPDEGSEGDLEHPEVEFRQADADQAHRQAQGRGGERSDEERDRGGHPAPRQRQGRPVGADPVEDGVTELVEAGVADGEVEARREQGGEQDDRRDVGVKPGEELRQGQKRCQQEEQEERRGRSPHRPVTTSTSGALVAGRRGRRRRRDRETRSRTAARRGFRGIA